jgi:hypothetical protein
MMFVRGPLGGALGLNPGIGSDVNLTSAILAYPFVLTKGKLAGLDSGKTRFWRYGNPYWVMHKGRFRESEVGLGDLYSENCSELRSGCRKCVGS